MATEASFTLSQIARRLDVPQHRLIHLCEKGVVVPEVHDATGRGGQAASSRPTTSWSSTSRFDFATCCSR